MMPYIKKHRRALLDDSESGPGAETAGELNYLITILLHRYLELHELSYQTLNDILGALDGAKMEFYRRVVAPYEDIKIKENGDVP